MTDTDQEFSKSQNLLIRRLIESQSQNKLLNEKLLYMKNHYNK